ncbi:unnamed protein product [Vitrella brassicaformis CCMP3155]|uniref:TauD/TfdA-like domain-containing protein n=1 Tax=Vitrella brassicaformis (strain CCMP3155) TaxID=1169540 RepID=A0A0G4ECC1_VITBC|nr:unnamed protein product [Vitrella brassicaformis CCMP3155]|eukprot:CEL93153.1 unnamed protein product [Vitrella brassicaformis CCMP3155]
MSIVLSSGVSLLPLSATKGTGAILKASDDTSLTSLCSVLRDNRSELLALWRTCGAILVRGYQVKTAEDFEKAASTLCHLLDRYPGNAPRNKVTQYVWTSTELPHYLPIPAHAELSYVPKARPAAILFFCEQPSTSFGQTPIVRLTDVWKSLPLWLQDKLERKGGFISVRRADAKGVRVFDFRSRGKPTKTWRAIFETDDPAEVEKQCHQDGVAVEWKNGQKGGDALLKTPFSATRMVDGTKAFSGWFANFIPAGAVIDSLFVAMHTRRARDVLTSVLLAVKCVIQMVVHAMWPSQRLSHSTYADGSEIPLWDIFCIVRAHWKHYVVLSWEKGDVLFVDNDVCGHARLPFDPPRRILTAIA